MPGPNSVDTEGGSELAAERGAEAGEFAAIERLAATLASAVPGPGDGEVWIGDDAAVLHHPQGPLLLTTDLSVLGVHADLSLMSVADMGWRALAASVSDIAAMGGRPRHAVVGVSGPPDSDLDGLYLGLAEASAAFGCPVVGGDLAGGERLVVAVTVTGDVGDGPDGPGPVLRSGARPGDHIWVTGPVGGSAAGLRARRARRDAGGPAVEAFLRPRPRCAEGAAARRAGASAMVDLSDGLLADLARLADASSVGYELDDVPVHAEATIDEALGGGEDYELVIVAPDVARVEDAFTRAGLRRPLQIGTCVADVAVRTLHGAAVARRGFEHHFQAPPPKPAAGPPADRSRKKADG